MKIDQNLKMMVPNLCTKIVKFFGQGTGSWVEFESYHACVDKKHHLQTCSKLVALGVPGQSHSVLLQFGRAHFSGLFEEWKDGYERASVIPSARI